jgi:zinc protease
MSRGRLWVAGLLAAALAVGEPALALSPAPLEPAPGQKAAAPERARHPDELRFEPLRFRPPAPAAHTLQNGLRLWVLEERSLPLVEGVLVFNAGSADDPPEGAGLAELVGELVRTGGTLTRPAEEVDAEIDRLGARLTVSVDDELTEIQFSILSRDLDRFLALLSDLLRNPAFRQDRLEAARAQKLEEIRRFWDDPGDIAEYRMADLIYGPGSRWARRPTAASVDWIGQDTCRAFQSRYLAPNRAWLGIAGDFDAREARRKIDVMFGHWRERPLGPRPHESFASGGASPPGVYWIERDLAQATVALGHLGARRHTPAHPALRVMNLILGGGYSSRLFRQVRTERGLAYGVSGAVREGYDRGMFRVDLSTQPPRAAEAIGVARQVLEGLRNAPPAPDEMRLAREREAHSFVFHFASPTGVVEERVLRAALGFPTDYLDTYLERIASVTPQDVQRAARGHVRPKDLIVLVVGPEAAVIPLREAGTTVQPLALDPGP